MLRQTSVGACYQLGLVLYSSAAASAILVLAECKWLPHLRHQLASHHQTVRLFGLLLQNVVHCWHLLSVVALSLLALRLPQAIANNPQTSVASLRHSYRRYLLAWVPHYDSHWLWSADSPVATQELVC